MLKTFDINTIRFSGDDYQDNKYAKVFSIPKKILHANNYSDDIHLVFSVYWLSNYHYARSGQYSLTVRQDLSNCLLQYLGEKNKTYVENGVCYKITDEDIEVYVKPSANGYATRINIEGNSKFYLYCKWYDGSIFEDIQTSSLTPSSMINNDYDTIIYNYLKTSVKNDVTTHVESNATKEVFRSSYTNNKIFNCNIKININSSSAGNGKIMIYVNGKIYDNIAISYIKGDTVKYINMLCDIKDGGNMYCQYYHYNANNDGCMITITPTTN